MVSPARKLRHARPAAPRPADRAEQQISEAARRALEHLVSGIDFGPIGVEDRELTTGLVRLILRIAFVLIGEEKGVLPHGSTDSHARRRPCSGGLGWKRLRSVFGVLRGAALFEPGKTPWIDRAEFEIPDSLLGAAVDDLGACLQAAGGDIDALGAVYEGLMGTRIRTHRAAGVRLEPTLERRRAGAHYTSSRLTRDLVGRTLSPLLADARTPQQILALKVCDPAVGSGAFLAEACRQLTEALVARGMRLETARALVAQDCLYGVDCDPLAVALARLSLWLMAGDRRTPLTFLDQKLVLGDALFGLDRSQLGTLRPLAGAASSVERWRDLGDLALARWIVAGSARERRRRWNETTRSVARLLGGGPTEAERRDARRLRERYSPFHWELEWPSVFHDAGGFDAIVGNPPWVAYAGRAAQPLRPELRDWYLFTSPAFAGYRTLHGLFVHRAATLLRIGGRLGLLLPTSLSDLAGYEPVRRAHDALCQADDQLPDYGDGAFPGVFQPCMGLVSTRSGDGRSDAAAGGLWPLGRRDLGPAGARLLAQLDALPKFARHLFGERGYQTRSSDADQIRAADAPSGRFNQPLRTGSEIEPFRTHPPRLFCDPTALAGTFRADAEWRKTELLIRQTARYPLVAWSDGLPFRNSVLAGFGDRDLPAARLIAWLNSSPIRWFHYQKNRDARQGMPQVKIAHLRDLPAPPTRGKVAADLERLGQQLGERNRGVGSREQARIDQLVARALGLTTAQIDQIVAWATQTRG